MPDISSSSPTRGFGFQFTLAAALGAMAWIGLVCLALRSPNSWWSSGFYAATILTLLVFVLVAIYREDRQRAFSIGFVVFGFTYLSLEGNDTRFTLLQLELPTGPTFMFCFEKIHPKRAQIEVGADPFSPDAFFRNDFRRICVSAMTLCIGFVGGMIGQFLYVTRRVEVADG